MSVTPMERLARAIALLLGSSLLSSALRWLVVNQWLSLEQLLMSGMVVMAIALFAAVILIPHPLATCSNPHLQQLLGVMGVGLVLGFL